jgi:hypothetical protein
MRFVSRRSASFVVGVKEGLDEAQDEATAAHLAEAVRMADDDG